MATPRIWGLLIGIDYYFTESPLSARSTSSLTGCVKDAKSAKSFLQTKYNVPDSQITLLVSPLHAPYDRQTKVPFDPESKTLPTYRNIMDTLDNYLKCLQAGDHFYFHYSGHGGRVRTPEKIQLQKWTNKNNTIDETLVPADIGLDSNQGKYIRDWELAYVFSKLRENKVEITVFMDSCHSGGVARGEKPGSNMHTNQTSETTITPDPSLLAHIRGIPYVVDHPKEWDLQTKFAHQDMYEAWEKLQKESTTCKTWLVQVFDYQMFSGCLQHEFSHEYRGAGVLSDNLTKALEAVGAGQRVTYHMIWRYLFDRAYGRIYDGNEKGVDVQTPLLLGKADRIFLGQPTDIIPHAPGIPVHALPSLTWATGLRNTKYAIIEERDDPKLVLRAGHAHGVKLGEVYAMYEWTATAEDMHDPDRSVGFLAVIEVYDVVSVLGRMPRPYDGQLSLPWQHGRQAVLRWGSPDPKCRTKVRVPMELSIFSQPVPGPTYYHGPVPFEFGTDMDDASYQIVSDKGMMRLHDADCQHVPNVPGYPTSHPRLLIESLTQICLYHQRRGIKSKGKYDECLFPLTIEKHESNIEGNSETTLSFSNKDGGQPVNVIVYHFTPNWGIRKIFPVNAEYESIDQNDYRRFRVVTPATNTTTKSPPNTDIFKAVIFNGSTSFSTWEMPDISPIVDTNNLRGYEKILTMSEPLMEPDARASKWKNVDKDVQEGKLNGWWTVQIPNKFTVLESRC